MLEKLTGIGSVVFVNGGGGARGKTTTTTSTAIKKSTNKRALLGARIKNIASNVKNKAKRASQILSFRRQQRKK